MKKRYLKAMYTVTMSCGMILPFTMDAAGEEINTSGSVTVGIQDLNLNGDSNSKFEEYEDGLQDTVFLEYFRFQGEKDDLNFNVEGRDIGQEDQSFKAEGGRYGKYKLKLKWDEIPHNFYEDGIFLGTETSPGVWQVPDIIQQTLEPGFPLGGDPPASPTAEGVANLQDLLGGAAKVDLRIERKTGSIGLTYSLFKNFNVRGEYFHENRDGYRAMATGGYRRDSNGAGLVGGIGENFTLYGLEFPEPIDYNTDAFNVGFDYRQDTWHVDFAYTLTSFSNETSSVTWDNPLLFTGVDDTQGGAALNRLDLYPDSTSHNLSLTGGLADLPLNSKLTATLSWDNVTQDDDFLAFTVNRALTVDNDGSTLGADLALPANDLDGDVTTTLFNVVLHSKPVDPLSVNLKVNYYDYNNDSRKVTLTDGWARIGESVWSKDSDDGESSRVPEYEKIRTTLDAAYTINHMVTAKADYRYETYNRNEDRNGDTSENIIGGSLKISPVDWALLRLGYHYADRKIDGDYTSVIGISHEWDQMRMTDQSAVQRNIFDVYLSLDPVDKLSLGFSLNYNDDEYDTTYYGLQESNGYMAGLDFNYMMSDHVAIFGYYARDDYETRQKNRTKSDNTGGGDFAVPENDWITDLDDTTDTIGAGTRIMLIPGKLTLELAADYSRATGNINTTNSNFVAGITTTGATAYDWPELKTDTTDLKADLDYHWTEQLSSGLHYLYKRLKFDDFATDDLNAYGNAVDTQGNTLSHYIFMDANYSDYEAHLIWATLSYSF